jgi:hypothetical protein
LVRSKILLLCFAIGTLSLSAAVLAGGDEPMFVRWLVTDDPGDETIRDYWERAERDELDAPELTDFGTMLFYRGYPKDAVRNFNKALDIDPDLYEAWFRIGLVEHSQGNLREARKAYLKCLKMLTGHGWCNFYLGLLEEQLGHSTEALNYYRRAFKFAPELSNPKVNPEMLTSELAFAAKLREYDRVGFSENLPLRYLQPAKVERLRQSFEAEPMPASPSQEVGETEAVEESPPPSNTKKAPSTRSKTPKTSSSVTSTQGTSQPPTSSTSTGTTPSPEKTESASIPKKTENTSPAPKPTPRSARQPFGMPPVKSTSPEAHLKLEIPGLWEFASRVI